MALALRDRPAPDAYVASRDIPPAALHDMEKLYSMLSAKGRDYATREGEFLPFTASIDLNDKLATGRAWSDETEPRGLVDKLMESFAGQAAQLKTVALCYATNDTIV